MDLIYTNAAGRELGVLFPSYFDEVFGINQENTFELQIPKNKHCCEKNSFIYIENSEIGGMVDSVNVSSEDDYISYKGRTWHGILNSKIIQPDKDDDYLVLYGEANRVLQELINRMGLNNIFSAAGIDSGVEIIAYQMPRYVKGYLGILMMLNEYGLKLIVTRKNRRTVLRAVETIDYSQQQEFSSQIISLGVKENYNLTNHLVCLGQGDLKDRAVIHLFTDEDGGIMPYTKTSQPLQDSDYILDESQQQLFNEKEIADIYDYPSAEITKNYILLSSQPNDWLRKFTQYFIQDEDGNYNQIPSEYEDVYNLISSKPSDWSKNFSNYFEKSGSDYKNIEGEDSVSYKKLVKKPSKWSKNYNQYYEFWSDGVTSEYKSVSGLLKYKYSKQTRKPTDWQEEFSKYYVKNNKGKYVSVEASGAPTFEKNKYYKKVKNRKYELLTSKPFDWNKRYKAYYYKKNSTYYSVEGVSAPKWKTKKYYTKISYTVAPKFEKNIYFNDIHTTVAPAWKENTYYTRVSERLIVPKFKKKTYYREVDDKYAVLIEGGIERLKELRGEQEIDISFNQNEQYDIGDTVGALEETTGIFVSQQIIKKNITLNEYKEYEQSYEVGDFDI